MFEQIYNENSTAVYSFLYKLCSDPAVAEELTQETFFRALKGFHKFRGESSVLTWLIAIAKRTYYAHLKSRKKGLECIDITEVVETYCEAEETMEDGVMRRMVTEKVRELLWELPDKYRDVVMLRVYAELSFAQIGSTMGITENSAKVIYFRAKNMLKERLK
ncbi:MAG: RNA polymerase sigma factor [Ruminococcaceae bacterium]|nr:RNA polymerase sigma factor [Oscillospiraceae bacterium]